MNRCKHCNSKTVSGRMYGELFIAGNADLKKAFYGREQLLEKWFPQGIPDMGQKATCCVSCFSLYTENGDK